MDHANRKRLRLPHYDYSKSGCYFITLCTQNRQHLFELENRTFTGDHDNKTDCCTQNLILHNWISELINCFTNISIDLYVILPDHLHMMITIHQTSGISLSDIMQYFKSGTTRDYISRVKEGSLPPFEKKLWQKSYYDHVIRNPQDYEETWRYIENNPKKWLMEHTP